jgi:Co/Zn/Cd efflux system component
MLTFVLVFAAISSSSLSLLATGIDALFDFGSNLLLFWLHKKASELDVNKWPVGGARLETIGNIVYGVSLLKASLHGSFSRLGFLCVLDDHLF